jgi:hypothetical protein
MRQFKIDSAKALAWLAVSLAVWCGSAVAAPTANTPGAGPLSYLILGFASLVFFGKKAWANRRNLPILRRFMRKP